MNTIISPKKRKKKKKKKRKKGQKKKYWATAKPQNPKPKSTIYISTEIIVKIQRKTKSAAIPPSPHSNLQSLAYCHGGTGRKSFM